LLEKKDTFTYCPSQFKALNPQSINISYYKSSQFCDQQ